MRYLSFIVLCVAWACGSSEPTPIEEVETVSGYFRYQEGDSSLQADLELPDSTTLIPSFLGSAMEPLGTLPARRFRYNARGSLPPVVRFQVDEPDGNTNFNFATHRVFVDSLPDTLYRDRAVNFPVTDRGLTELESLVVFFEPADRSTPKRILVTGPTEGGTVSLPSSAVDDIAPGNYEVYLVKQRLFKDQIRTLRASVQSEYFTRSRSVIVN
ncbi:hypothetical protein [Lewinella sp. IMCC34183]|uniref:hypothetical protein n=1 Tax=Lewinella sp. IMCC34183 TaxID=2248762 RepID=UPI000E26E1A2|nr:hypothetical protein [Lewinella sp. IMCC34183]